MFIFSKSLLRAKLLYMRLCLADCLSFYNNLIPLIAQLPKILSNRRRFFLSSINFLKCIKKTLKKIFLEFLLDIIFNFYYVLLKLFFLKTYINL